MIGRHGEVRAERAAPQPLRAQRDARQERPVMYGVWSASGLVALVEAHELNSYLGGGYRIAPFAA